MTRDLFPSGSDRGQTDALPAIWEKSADFEKAVEALELAASKLGATKSADTEAVKAAFGQVGKACKGCHDSFRMKK
jgi:cytochrome c556